MIHFNGAKSKLSIAVGLGIGLGSMAVSANANSLCDNYGSTLFGDHVCILDSSQSKGDIQSIVNNIHKQQKDDEFGSNGYALLFKPGNYGNLSVPVGYYTQVSGLGTQVDDTNLGTVKVDQDDLHGNTSLTNFWRSADNFHVDGNNVWAVSQASPLRRVHIGGVLVLALGSKHYASGGFLANSKVDTGIASSGQQQWLTRNTSVGKWYDPGVWNMVFVGNNQSPSEGNWQSVPNTVIDKTPNGIEAPYLSLDNKKNQYQVKVASLQKDSQGEQWQNQKTVIPQTQFIILKPGDGEVADQISAQMKKLDSNKPIAIIVTPGQYDIHKTINLDHDSTVMMGLGVPVLTMKIPHQVMIKTSANGIRLGGMILEAGSNDPIKTQDPSLLEVDNSSHSNSNNPSLLYDVYCRVGGRITGQTNSCITINQDNVIGDNLWLWRADHGTGSHQWNLSPSNFGLIVNGNNVTMYGLAVEHENNQTVWNGEHGRVYFYQSELPYDVPANYVVPASFKINNKIQDFKGYGFGIYDFFRDGSTNASSESAIETPDSSGISFKHLTTVKLGPSIGQKHIEHVLKVYKDGHSYFVGDSDANGMFRLDGWH